MRLVTEIGEIIFSTVQSLTAILGKQVFVFTVLCHCSIPSHRPVSTSSMYLPSCHIRVTSWNRPVVHAIRKIEITGCPVPVGSKNLPLDVLAMSDVLMFRLY